MPNKKNNNQGKESQPDAGEVKNEKLAEELLASAELDELRKKASECDELHNKWLSALAECENMRKRVEKEKVNFLKFANEDIIMELFPIMDNFDWAISMMDKAEDKMAVIDGIKMVQKEFHRVLEGNGVTRIKTEGEKFNPHLHEAAEIIETDKYPDGAVIEEMRPGYTLNDRLIRPAQVKVAKAPHSA